MNPEVVLITGCSSGIGRATATTLAAAGYEVVATARRSEDLQGIGAAMALPLDVTDEASIEAAVGAVLERYGRIDVLVNNAGYALRGAIEEVDVEAVRRMFDVNVNGVIRMVQAVVPSMRSRGSGRIVTIGSESGKLSAPVNGTYSATKHALEAVNDALRWELGPFGIAVVLIEPGNIGTPVQRDGPQRFDSLARSRRLALRSALRSLQGADDALPRARAGTGCGGRCRPLRPPGPTAPGALLRCGPRRHEDRPRPSRSGRRLGHAQALLHPPIPQDTAGRSVTLRRGVLRSITIATS